MTTKTVLITGSSGLIGSEAVRFFAARGFSVIGVDNNLRKYFFGPDGDTDWMLKKLVDTVPGFRPVKLDIRDRQGILDLFKDTAFDCIVHCAAQPSHDWAAKEPFTDFDINAVGTLNLLEACRLTCREAPFIFMSTNKVYGDRPNAVALVEKETRYDFADPQMENGFDETFPIDDSTHSLFGASKLSADILTQEYGRYFNMPTVAFRGGCLTGPAHSGAMLHGFLSYLIGCAVRRKPYTVLGYKGKQVRDNIHSSDVVSAMWEYYLAPRSGEVYNIGGERENARSILEMFQLVESLTGREVAWSYEPKSRIGDHICYISNMAKFRKHYPRWQKSYSLVDITREIMDSIKTIC